MVPAVGSVTGVFNPTLQEPSRATGPLQSQISGLGASEPVIEVVVTTAATLTAISAYTPKLHPDLSQCSFDKPKLKARQAVGPVPESLSFNSMPALMHPSKPGLESLRQPCTGNRGANLFFILVPWLCRMQRTPQSLSPASAPVA